MKTIFILISITFFISCTSKDVINLKIFSKEKEGSHINKSIHTKITVANKSKKNKSIPTVKELEWKNVKILYNEFQNSINLKNKDKNITLLKGEGALVDDIIDELNFSSRRDFFNFLDIKRKNSYEIYQMINQNANEQNITHKYIYGIVLRKNKGAK